MQFFLANNLIPMTTVLARLLSPLSAGPFSSSLPLCNWIVRCATILRLFNGSITTGWAQDCGSQSPDGQSSSPAFLSSPLSVLSSLLPASPPRHPTLPNASFVLALNSRLLFQSSPPFFFFKKPAEPASSKASGAFALRLRNMRTCHRSP